MPRVLIPPEAVRGDQITIDDPRDVHHLARVLRVKSGELLEGFDGQGGIYRGRVTHVGKQRIIVSMDQHRQEPTPAVQLTLAQSLIEPARFEWVLQKATELGAARITPVLTSRTVVRPSARGAAHRLERWRRIVIEACAQCGRARLPVVDEPMRFEDILKLCKTQPLILPTLAVSGTPLAACLAQLNGATQITILIGPEGDFTPDEVRLGQRAGAHLVSLGKTVLRSETAAVATLVILQHTLGML
jgi:16S rRNA (uracil1498-N3)-methyltransferase